MVRLFVLFFFFKQKTAYEMRISDWSSDVCSSDLRHRPIELRLSGSRTCTTLAVATGAWLVSKARQAGSHDSPQNSSSCLTLPSRSSRSEERRGGKGSDSQWRYRWARCHITKKIKQRRHTESTNRPTT